jgi:hypothetical protein
MKTLLAFLFAILATSSARSALANDVTINPSGGSIVINRNAGGDPAVHFAGQGITLIGPDYTETVDHPRVQLYGFHADPIFGCDYANGTRSNPAAVKKGNILCTWQGRGCADPNGCSIDSLAPNGARPRGYSFASVQLRILSTEDWTSTGHGTQLCTSTTQNGTIVESNKWCISNGGHIEYANTTPTIVAGTGCGSRASIRGTDNAFKVILGAIPGSTCQIRFGAPWEHGSPYEPICVASNESHPVLTQSTAITSTGLTLAGSFSGGDKINVICAGIN